MKEVGNTSWSSPNKDATNTSLFTGLPGGERDRYLGYVYLGISGNWWSSTDCNGYNTVMRALDCLSGSVNSYCFEDAISIRCVKD